MLSEEEIYKMLLVEKLDKFPLLNELFAIRDSRGKRNDYTIFVNGYISLDVINKAVEKVNLLDNLKEIEQSHKEENGKLRVELEEEKEKNKELQKYEEAYKLLSYGLNNYISKDRIKAEMEDIIDYFEYANATSEDMEFLEKKKKEILEGK